jgi:very-short-patch-repair endonuclease
VDDEMRVRGRRSTIRGVEDVEVAKALAELGGVSTRARLVKATSRARVDAALREGAIVVVARGRYALPAVDEALCKAAGLSGLLSLTSAALFHGWEVKAVPERPHVTVPRRRRVPRDRRAGVVLHRCDVHPDDIVDGIATGIELTLAQCLTRLPFDEALAIADSALRHGVPPAVLRRVARSVTGQPGAAQARRVVELATPDAANPFESVLRAICLDVPGLAVRPQLLILTPMSAARPDLVDEDLRIVLEADSFAWHGDRAALRRDARRYNLLVCDGWLVLRFAWEDVMSDPDHVRGVLVALVRLVHRQTECPRPCCRAA